MPRAAHVMVGEMFLWSLPTETNARGRGDENQTSCVRRKRLTQCRCFKTHPEARWTEGSERPGEGLAGQRPQCTFTG